MTFSGTWASLPLFPAAPGAGASLRRHHPKRHRHTSEALCSVKEGGQKWTSTARCHPDEVGSERGSRTERPRAGGGAGSGKLLVGTEDKGSPLPKMLLEDTGGADNHAVSLQPAPSQTSIPKAQAPLWCPRHTRDFQQKVPHISRHHQSGCPGSLID